MKTNIGKIGMLLAAFLLVGSVFAGSVMANTDNSDNKAKPENIYPYTKLQGTMITTYEFKDGYLTITETFSGADLKRIYGEEEISNVEKFKIDKNLTGIKRKTEYKELYVIRADEKDKIAILSSYPYPQWTYTLFGIFFIRSDPINLAWEDSSEPMVKSWLQGEGWTWACSGIQFVFDQGIAKPQDDSLEDPGSSCFDTEGRTHIRLWQLSNGDVVAGAHNEYWTGTHHMVTSFESGENRVDDDFYDPFWWDVDEDSVYLNNYMSSPYNNGWATVITQQPV